MDWHEYLNPDVPAILLDALRGGRSPFPLSGFFADKDLGRMGESIIGAVIEATEQLWGSQLQDGMSCLPVSEVMSRLGVSDLNSVFARRLQQSLEERRDAVVSPSTETIKRVVGKVKRRQAGDSLAVSPTAAGAKRSESEVGMRLNDTEKNILQALGKEKMVGEDLAKKAGYPFNSNLKTTLSSLRKRGIIGNAAPGYFLEPKYHHLLDKGQDKGQD